MTSELNHVQVDEGEAVMFVVIGQESQHGILILDLCVKDGLVPADPLLKAPRAVDEMDELGRTDAWHGEPSSRR